MRKYTFVIIVILSVAFAAVSCNGNKQNVEDSELIPEVKMKLYSEDTTAVYQLLNTYLNFLKSGNLDEAVAMLHSVSSKDSLIALTDVQKKRLKGSFTIIANKDFKIDYLKFYKDMDNEVKIKCILFENKPGENAPNEINMVLRPVRYLNEWYLTVADDVAHPSEIKK